MKNNLSFIDVCFLVSSSVKKSYQTLAQTYAAIEPPTWALLLAQSCRSVGYKVAIVDANAENLSDEQVLKRINKLKLSHLSEDLLFQILFTNAYSPKINLNSTIMNECFNINKIVYDIDEKINENT